MIMALWRLRSKEQPLRELGARKIRSYFAIFLANPPFVEIASHSLRAFQSQYVLSLRPHNRLSGYGVKASNSNALITDCSGSN